MPFCCFIAFSKHVKLCFRPLSGFVILHIKMLGEWGRGGGGGRRGNGEGILESPCPCVRLFVCLSAGLCPEDIL